MGKFGIWRPVTRYQSGSLRIPMTPRRLVFHTAVSSAASMFSYFNVSGRASPHFYVNKEGEAEQYINTDYRSTANLDGNDDCVTVESWDNGCPGGVVPAWTDAQVETLAKLALWCHEHHGIPLERLSSSLPGTQGIGWHRLGIDGNFPDPPGGLLGGRVTGGEHWSTSAGKICPGDKKIQGTVDLIIPRALELLNGDDDMALDDKVNDEHTVKQVLNRLDRFMTNSALKLVTIREDLEQLVAEVAALPDGTSVGKTREVVRRNADAIKAHMDELDQEDPPPMKPPVPEEIPA